MKRNLKCTLFFASALLLALQTTIQAQNNDKPVYQFVDDIEVPHTIVQNQGSSGTCWDFAGTGFVEAEILRKYGVVLNLSEIDFDRWAYNTKVDKYVRVHG